MSDTRGLASFAWNRTKTECFHMMMMPRQRQKQNKLRNSITEINEEKKEIDRIPYHFSLALDARIP